MWESPGPVGPRAQWIWGALRYAGGRTVFLAGEYPYATVVTTAGLTSGRVWIRGLTWDLLKILTVETAKSTWAISSRSAAAIGRNVPGVARATTATRTAAARAAAFAKSPAGKGLGAGLAIGTLLAYPGMVKHGYIQPSIAISPEQNLAEIMSSPGVAPGVGTRPIIYGGGGGGIIV